MTFSVLAEVTGKLADDGCKIGLPLMIAGTQGLPASSLSVGEVLVFPLMEDMAFEFEVVFYVREKWKKLRLCVGLSAQARAQSTYT